MYTLLKIMYDAVGLYIFFFKGRVHSKVNAGCFRHCPAFTTQLLRKWAYTKEVEKIRFQIQRK